MYTLSPNTNVVENLIDNYESGRISMIYGNSASGKTTCCLLASFCAENNKVIYIVNSRQVHSPKSMVTSYLLL